jgi:CheY-like chemotaxis protein
MAMKSHHRQSLTSSRPRTFRRTVPARIAGTGAAEQVAVCPCRPDARFTVVPPTTPEEGSLPQSGGLGVAGRRRLLVADDEIILRNIYRMALSAEDVSITSCADGRSALDEARRRGFDLMLLDLRMPRVGGLSVLRQLREAGDLTPVVICTAELDPLSFLRGVRQGVAIFLRKPLSVMTLRRAIHEQLRGFAGRRFGAAFRALGRLSFRRAVDLMDQEPEVGEKPSVREWRRLCGGIDEGRTDEQLMPLARGIISRGLGIPYEV